MGGTLSTWAGLGGRQHEGGKAKRGCGNLGSLPFGGDETPRELLRRKDLGCSSKAPLREGSLLDGLSSYLFPGSPCLHFKFSLGPITDPADYLYNLVPDSIM
jgi:hypothetical protein